MVEKLGPPPIHMFLPPETVETVETVARYGSDLPADLAFEEPMALLFSDMRGFTELAEQFEPRQVYATINASLAVQTRIVRKHGGSVNKFLGDGLLACFSGDDRIERAVNCVVEVLRVLPHQAGDIPCGVGLGLHCGQVLFGLLGDEKRREFTVIGDVANTAARLCGVASPFEALVTESIVSNLPEAMREKFCRYKYSKTLKGKKEPIRIYHIRYDHYGMAITVPDNDFKMPSPRQPDKTSNSLSQLFVSFQVVNIR